MALQTLLLPRLLLLLLLLVVGVRVVFLKTSLSLSLSLFPPSFIIVREPTHVIQHSMLAILSLSLPFCLYARLGRYNTNSTVETLDRPLQCVYGVTFNIDYFEGASSWKIIVCLLLRPCASLFGLNSVTFLVDCRRCYFHSTTTFCSVYLLDIQPKCYVNDVHNFFLAGLLPLLAVQYSLVSCTSFAVF